MGREIVRENSRGIHRGGGKCPTLIGCDVSSVAGGAGGVVSAAARSISEMFR